jgi:hypothetical protein
METMIDLPVASNGTESRGDQLAALMAAQAGAAVASLERALEFLGADYVRPTLSDPEAGLERCCHLMATHPERLAAIREDAKRFRFEALESAYSALLQHVQTEIQVSYGHVALGGLYAQLERLADDARTHWANGRRERAIDALRAALRGVERAYEPLNGTPFRGKGSVSSSARKGQPNANRKPAKGKGPSSPRKR